MNFVLQKHLVTGVALISCGFVCVTSSVLVSTHYIFRAMMLYWDWYTNLYKTRLALGYNLKVSTLQSWNTSYHICYSQFDIWEIIIVVYDGMWVLCKVQSRPGTYIPLLVFMLCYYLTFCTRLAFQAESLIFPAVKGTFCVIRQAKC